MGHTADNFDIDGTLNVDGAVTMASTLAVTGAITSQSVVIPKYQVVAGPTFYQADCTASQSAVALNLLGATVPTGWVPGRACSVRTTIVNLETARSAGTLTVQLTKNGTADTDSNMVISTAVAYGRTNIAHGSMALAATDILGCKITTDGDWAAGTTPELFVHTEIAYDVAV